MSASRSPPKDKSLRALAFEETKEAPPETEAPPFLVEERPATAASAPSRPTTPAADEAADVDESATVATADEEAPAGDGFAAPDVEE